VAPPVVRGYATVGTRQVHYRECRPSEGGENPTRVLLLHQVSSSSAMYEQVMPLLAEAGLMCVAPDTPGFGASDPLDSDATVDDYVEAIIGFVDAMGWTKPFVVVGHHNGARRGTLLSARVPERVLGLVAVGLPYHRDKRARAQSFVDKKIQDPVPAADGSHVMHEWQRLAELGPEMSPELHTRELIDTLRAENYAAMYRLSFSHDVEDALAQVTVPTLLVAPSADQLAERQRMAADITQDAEVVDIDGGVFVFDTHPGVLAEVITAFVEKISPRPFASTDTSRE
jgi:pimeloyl-ACP methyl ester carboxylesterase